MYIIRPEIFKIKGFNSEHYWLLSNSFAKRMKNETRECFPSLETIAKDCEEWSEKNQKYESWGISKVSRVIADLIKFGIITKKQELKFGGGFKNIYKVETDLVEVTIKIKLEGKIEEQKAPSQNERVAEDQKQENPEQTAQFTPSQNGTVHPPKMEFTPSQNGSLTRASIELTTTTTTTAREEFLNFEFDEVRKSLIQKEYNLTDNEIQLALLNFKDEPKYKENPPVNIAKTFTSWLINEGMAKFKREKQKTSYNPQPKSSPPPTNSTFYNLTEAGMKDKFKNAKYTI